MTEKKTRIVACLLTLVLGVGIGVGGYGIAQTITQSPVEVVQEANENNGGMVLPEEATGNGISLLSARIVTEDYDEYGISPQAESAVTLTATVKPDNVGTNTGVNWDIKWKNALSSWAAGKNVADYVTLTPSGNGYAESKTATLENLQAFGEQIVVTVTARDNAEATASCSVDYAQKITDISVKFGNVSCNFGGRTGVVLELNESGTPKGGPISSTETKDSVYTIADTFSIKYELKNPRQFLTVTPANTPNSYPHYMGFCSIDSDYSSNYTAFNSYSVPSKGLYFGIKYFVDNLGLHSIQSGRGNLIQGDIYDSNASYPITVADIMTRFDKKGTTDDTYCYGTDVDLFDLTVTVKGTYSTITRTTTFYMSGYTNSSEISAVEIDKSSVVF